MDATKIEKEIYQCSKCQGAGWINNPKQVCEACRGLGYAEEVRGVKLFWGKRMRGISPALRASFYRTASLIEMGGFFFCILFLLAGGLNLFDSLMAHEELAPDLNLFFDVFFAGYATAPLWLGIVLAIVLYFHHFVYSRPKKITLDNPEYYYLLVDEVKNARPKTKKIDISFSADQSTIRVIRRALDLAYRAKQEPGGFHLLLALAEEKEIGNLFFKLEIPLKEFIFDAKTRLGEIKAGEGSVLGGELKKLLFQGFWEAVKVEEDAIRPQHLLFSLVTKKELKTVLNKYEVSVEDFHNIILWVKYSKLNTRDYLSKDSFKKPPHRYMNRGWSAIQTKILDQFSVDITDYARAGMLLPLVDRENEMRMLIRILTRSAKNNALIIGKEGSGRDALVRGLARRIVRNRVSGELFDKRVVKLNVGTLGTGVGSNGGILKQRIEQIMAEVVRTQNVIIYIPNIHKLAKVQAFATMDVISFLAPLFSESVIQVIGSTTPKDYHDYVEPRGEFAQTFDEIKIEELSKEDSLKVLSMEVPFLERKNRMAITYQAAEEAVKSSDLLVKERLLPGKALDVIAEAIVRARDVKGAEIVTEEEVREIFSQKTGIPITKVKEKEAGELLNLEQEIAKKVIGQEEAVKETAAAIRRSRVKIGETERPIAVFMFVGPTGVGKTELSKTLAEIYFGSREKMVRIDMSEFATPYDLERLIGNAGGTVTGLLTEPVRKNPYTLVLLDEFEKAHPTVWDIFLQVFDDGRVTDGRGNVINFMNTILIATSNVGSKMILQNLQEGRSNKELKPIIKKELLSFFRPEFLNRFDEIITFNALSEENIKAIANLEIERLNERIEEEQGLQIKLTEEALDYLVEIGYSPEFGARFLKRTIRGKIEDALVIGILKGQYPRGSVVEISREMMESNS